MDIHGGIGVTVGRIGTMDTGAIGTGVMDTAAAMPIGIMPELIASDIIRGSFALKFEARRRKALAARRGFFFDPCDYPRRRSVAL
jgi:hypothetical protein